jgi:hypothetical protein
MAGAGHLDLGAGHPLTDKYATLMGLVLWLRPGCLPDPCRATGPVESDVTVPLMYDAVLRIELH